MLPVMRNGRNHLGIHGMAGGERPVSDRIVPEIGAKEHGNGRAEGGSRATEHGNGRAGLGNGTAELKHGQAELGSGRGGGESEGGELGNGRSEVDHGLESQSQGDFSWPTFCRGRMTHW